MTGAGLETSTLTAKLTAVARATWKKDAVIARAFLRHRTVVADTVAIVNGVPVLRSPAAFAGDFAAARTAELLEDAVKAGSAKDRKRNSRQAAASRKLELWAPFGKKSTVAGVVTLDGRIANTPTD